jgi:hypothetical protein
MFQRYLTSSSGCAVFVVGNIFCINIFSWTLPLFAIEPVIWNNTVLVDAVPHFEDHGRDTRHIRPGRFGSQYGRMDKLADGSWLIVYTIYDNSGYEYSDAHHLLW